MQVGRRGGKGGGWGRWWQKICTSEEKCVGHCMTQIQL